MQGRTTWAFMSVLDKLSEILAAIPANVHLRNPGRE